DGYAETVAGMNEYARRSFLSRMATIAANQERTDYDHFTGNFRYSSAEVRTLLERGALSGVSYDVDEEPVTVSGEIFGASDSVNLFIETDQEISVEDIDVRHAIRRIHPNYQEILVRKYVQDEDPPPRMQRQRAIDALTRVMNHAWRRANTEHEGPGSRKVISNARAAIINKRQTER